MDGKYNVLGIINEEDVFCLRDNSIDLLVSSNNLHMVNDIYYTLQRYHQCLKADGVILGSIFGEETLQELRISFTLSESERSGGVSQHTYPLHSIQEVGNMIAKLNYRIPTINTSTRLLLFPSCFHLMMFLQTIGQNSVVLSELR